MNRARRILSNLSRHVPQINIISDFKQYFFRSLSYLMSALRLQHRIWVVLVLKPAAVARIGLVVLDDLDGIPHEARPVRRRRRRRRRDDAVGEADFLLLVGERVSVVEAVNQVGSAAEAAEAVLFPGTGAGAGTVDLELSAASPVSVVMMVVVGMLPMT